MSLKFFNELSGTLAIELTEPTKDIAANLANQRATATAKISELSFAPEVFEGGKFRELTGEELDRVVLELSVLNLRGFGDAVAHPAPNGKWFTVRDLVAAVSETERRTRHQTGWYGGIDVHHVYFEGIHPGDDGVWAIHWGS
ncbi:hypothetical protein [Nocardia sp. NPDC049707]|uniref:hypothetical protein n=1 Tax=Nocardia sp. NPDC049707 TaxID=3154735 RepID=UPI0034481DA9